MNWSPAAGALPAAASCDGAPGNGGSPARGFAPASGQAATSLNVTCLEAASAWPVAATQPSGRSAVQTRCSSRCGLRLKAMARSTAPSVRQRTASSVLTTSHFQNDAGVLLRHTVDEARQKAVHVAVHGRKPELALAHALQLLDVGQRAVEVGLPALRQRQQQLPGCREPHAARQPLEQRHAHVFLQHEDLAVDGRGRDRHLAGGRLHRPELGHSRQIAQGLGMQGGVQGGHALPETGWNMLNYAMDSNASCLHTASHDDRHQPESTADCCAPGAGPRRLCGPPGRRRGAFALGGGACLGAGAIHVVFGVVRNAVPVHPRRHTTREDRPCFARTPNWPAAKPWPAP
jgi:hypothetical protein